MEIFKDFGMSTEIKNIINGQKEEAIEKINKVDLEDEFTSYGQEVDLEEVTTETTEDNNINFNIDEKIEKIEDEFALYKKTLEDEFGTIKDEITEDEFNSAPQEYMNENSNEFNEFKKDYNLESKKEELVFNFNKDKYIDAMQAFTEYMPINLSIDRYIPTTFTSLIDSENSEATIVIEKLGNHMIAMIHNLTKRPVPAMLNENRQPVIRWEDSLQNYMERLSDEITLRYSLEYDEFKIMKKIIILENMNEKVDLNQNETYITRQEVVDSLLNKYESIIDLTANNCSINFTEKGKKYSLNISGLGHNANLNSPWTEEIRSKIMFMREKQILLTGRAANSQIVSTLKETYRFNILNEGQLKNLAIEI